MNCVGKQNIWDKLEGIIIEETVTWMLAYGKNLAIHNLRIYNLHVDNDTCLKAINKEGCVC